MRWLQFILSHSIYISFCAVALCSQTFILLHIPFNDYLLGLIFFATLSSYNFYWLVSKYYFNRGMPLLIFLEKNRSNVFILLLAAAGLLFCMHFLPGILLHMGVAVALTLLYSVPLWPVKALEFTRRAGFLKTVLLAFTWAYVTVIIPGRQSLFTDKEALLLLFSARFLFMLMLCIIFDSRDVTVDKMHSLRSLATDVSRQGLQIIITIVFTLYLSCGFLLRFVFDDKAQVIAFVITGVITLSIYLQSLRNRAIFFIIFWLTGSCSFLRSQLLSQVFS